MNGFADARDTLAGKLTAAGVANVTVDPRVEAPYVLVDVPEVLGTEGIGAWQVQIPVQLAAPPPGDADAIGWLLDQLEAVLVTLWGAAARPQTVGDNNLPGYVVTVTTTVPNPNC